MSAGGSTWLGKGAGVGLLLWLWLPGAPDARAAAPPPPASEECLACHDVDPARLARSAHEGLACVQCHADVRDVPHGTPPRPPRCEGCHRAAAAEYRRSVHQEQAALGQALGPTCGSCHGPGHEVLPARDPASPVYHLSLPRTCGQCHGGPGPAARASRAGDVYALYLDSIHGRAVTRSGLLVAANCSDCHGYHEIRRRTDPAARVFRTNVAGTCGQCHAGVRVRYEQGVHGRALRDGNPVAPVCNDCHTAHQIRRVESEPWKLDIVQECGACHAESLTTYRDTFHGQVTALGFTRVARCSDCHGAHDILPAADPRSRVNAANLVATCRTCHPSANANFVKYDPHADPKDRARNPVYYYAARFMTWLLVGVFGLFGVHTALWAVRSLVARVRGEGRHAGPDDREAGA